jgi:hypothetical protein
MEDSIMTKQHFIAFARRINADLAFAKGHPDGEKLTFAAREAAIVVADIAQQFNPRFDRERFMTACGL